MLKKITAVFFAALLCVLGLASCTDGGQKKDDKLNIVCSVFPQYDWVRELAGENLKNINLTLLLDSGTDLHSYQPTAQDVVALSGADIFIYVGGESDTWVESTLKSADNPNLRTISMMSCLGDDVYKVEPAAGAKEHEHDNHDGHHHHVYDEHIWLSPKKALIICGEIKNALCEKDAPNKTVYEKAFAAYEKKLSSLDGEIQKTVDSAARDTVIFADRFPFVYLTNDYGIKHFAAFSGCSAESEASFETVTLLAKKADELRLPVLLITETGDGTIARTVRDSTKTKDQKILVMNAMQSITADKLGNTYIDIMTDNLAVLRQALN